MVEADAVVTVLERQHALDFMGADHRVEHVMHRQRRLTVGPRLAAEVVRDSENAAEVIRRMTPFRREPGVVEVEPAIHGADVERRHDGFQLVRGPGDPRAAGQRRAGNNGPE